MDEYNNVNMNQGNGPEPAREVIDPKNITIDGVEPAKKTNGLAYGLIGGAAVGLLTPFGLITSLAVGACLGLVYDHKKRGEA